MRCVCVAGGSLELPLPTQSSCGELTGVSLPQLPDSSHMAKQIRKAPFISQRRVTEKHRKIGRENHSTPPKSHPEQIWFNFEVTQESGFSLQLQQLAEMHEKKYLSYIFICVYIIVSVCVCTCVCVVCLVVYNIFNTFRKNLGQVYPLVVRKTCYLVTNMCLNYFYTLLVFIFLYIIAIDTLITSQGKLQNKLLQKRQILICLVFFP